MDKLAYLQQFATWACIFLLWWWWQRWQSHCVKTPNAKNADQFFLASFLSSELLAEGTMLLLLPATMLLLFSDAFFITRLSNPEFMSTFASAFWEVPSHNPNLLLCTGPVCHIEDASSSISSTGFSAKIYIKKRNLRKLIFIKNLATIFVQVILIQQECDTFGDFWQRFFPTWDIDKVKVKKHTWLRTDFDC